MNILKKNAKGFTLVELLVATVITVILLAVLFNVANLATKTMDTASGRVEKAENATAILDHIGKDLESVVIVPGSTEYWVTIGRPGTSSFPDPTGGLTNPYGPSGSEAVNKGSMCLYTAARDRYDGKIGVTGVDMGGDVSCVAYQLFWRNDVNSLANTSDSIEDDRKFSFFRSLIFPDDTYDNVLGEDDVHDEMFNTDNTVLTPNASHLVGSRDLIATNVYEVTYSFEVEYTNSTGRHSKYVVVKPNTTWTSTTNLTPWITISGRGFTSDARIGGSKMNDLVKAGTIWGVKALSMTVTLNVMDDNTQTRIVKLAQDGISMSRADILKECKAFTRTYRLPQY